MAGQIINRGERTWLVRVFLGRDVLTGKKKYHNKTVKGTKKDAQRYLNGVLRDIDLGKFAEPKKISLNRFLEKWLSDAVKPRVRERTYHSYEQLLKCYLISADDVLIGPGSKELLYLAQLCYGAELVIPSPSWVSYQPQASLAGLGTRWLQTRLEEGWRLDPRTLAQACQHNPSRPRLLILNYPNNPTGTSLDQARLRELAEVCREFRVLVVSDEIYGEVHHRGEHVSLSRYYPEGTIVSGGLSKWCGAGGWRLGTFAFPGSLDWLRQAMAVAASETFTSVSAPIQWAAIRAFQNDHQMESYLERSRAILKVVGEWVHQRLTDCRLLAPSPEGGFYLFAVASEPLRQSLAEREIRDSPTLCERLLAEIGVAVLLGTQFGRPAEELSFRLATVNFDGARALKAAENDNVDESFLRTYCPDLVQAIEKLSTWLNEASASV